MTRKLATLLALVLIGNASALKVHLFSPWAADPTRTSPPAQIMIQGKDPGYYPGTLMTADGGDWYSYTFKAAPAAYDGFKFVNYVSAGGQPYSNPLTYDNGGKDFNMGTVFLTPGLSEVWIIPQGAGQPPIITDIPPHTKAVYLFNPWPETAPSARIGTDTAFTPMRLSPDKSRCNWYVLYFTTKEYSVYFKSNVGTGTYGLGGINTVKPIDLTSYFATDDTVFIVPDPIPGGPPKIQSAFPDGVVGICTFPLAVTIRDFSVNHTDFEKSAMGGAVIKNMVQPILPPDKKPLQGPVNYFQTHFDHWFVTDSTNPTVSLRNYETCRDLPVSKDRYGYWGYDSYDNVSHSFFPIDDFNRFNETFQSHYRDRTTGSYVTDTVLHNFSFCMEMHANFKYQKGQVFRFSGDDDVWVYINNKLAVDLGGTHSAESDSVQVDNLGLTAGNKYDFDLYYCERKTMGSNFLMQTSIFFEQDQSIYAVKSLLPGGKEKYDIFEIISGDQSCGSTKGGDTTSAKSIFKLSGPSVNPAQQLPKGVSFGGITINDSATQIQVDTSKITGLRPGLYTITYISQKTGKGSNIQFTVSGSLSVEFADTPPINAIKGTSIPVTIQAVLNGALDKRAETFRLAPDANLLVYADSALTQPIAAGTDLTTDAATGLKKVYATSQVPGTYKLDLQGGPTKIVVMDTYGNLTFYAQPKVSKPSAIPAGQTFILPITVTIITSTSDATIFYTLDGTDPATAEGGSTKKFTAAFTLDHSATVKAIGVKAGWLNSDVMAETYTYSAPIGVKKAWYQDLDGDGRIETVRLDFAADLPALPDRIFFNLADAAGRNAQDTAMKSMNEIAFVGAAKSQIRVTFATPLVFGLTSLNAAASSGQIFRQDNIPVLDGVFNVDDSVPPVIMTAEVKEPEAGQPLKRILITLSENVTLPLSAQDALVFKRDGQEFAPAQVKLNRIEKTGDRDFVLYVDSTTDVFPIAGDSVAINTNGTVSDANQNIPAHKFFRKLDGNPPKASPVDFFVTFPNGSKDKPATGAEAAGPGSVVFIPVGRDGGALPGSENGKCGSCAAFDGNVSVGPIFHITTAAPVTFEFTIFNTLGEFVVAGSGKIEAQDLPLLDKTNDASGLRYQARVVWTGRTAKGDKAATGAYVLLTKLRTEKDFKTGAPASVETKRTVFGMLRSFRGS